MSEKEENKISKEEMEMISKQDYDELDDRYKRLLAEFENYKKRSQKEKESLYSSILADVVEFILPAVDNLENAVEQYKTVTTESALFEADDVNGTTTNASNQNANTQTSMGSKAGWMQDLVKTYITNTITAVRDRNNDYVAILSKLIPADDNNQTQAQ